MSCSFGMHVFVEGVCPHCGETKQDYIYRLERTVLIAAHHVADIMTKSFSNPENLTEKRHPNCFATFWKNYFWDHSEIKPE